MTFTQAPAIAVVGVGGYLSASFIRDLYYAFKSKQWPTTNGKVNELALINVPVIRGRYYSALVGYEYEVGGVRYTSTRIDYAGRGSGWNARSYLRRYDEGGSVVVRYDPTEPKRAVLETGLSLGNFLRLLVAFAVVGFGLLIFPAG